MSETYSEMVRKIIYIDFFFLIKQMKENINN